MKEVVLMKELPYLRIEVHPVELTQTIFQELADTPQVGHWQEIGADLYVHESTIDIAGLTKLEDTFYPLSGDVQRGAVSMGLCDGFLTEWILVTAYPIELRSPYVTNLNMWNHLPGQLRGTTEFQNIMWGREWVYTRNTTLVQNWGVQVHTSMLGSGEPSNADKLYVYRVVRLTAPIAGGSTEIPAARLLLSGQVREEAEYSQIMRMRRSYELAQETDVD